MSKLRKRRYCLSLGGLLRLQAAIQNTKPWQRATGPRTVAGKARSSRNALKHGRRTHRAIVEQRNSQGFSRLALALVQYDGALIADLRAIQRYVLNRRQPIPLEVQKKVEARGVPPLFRAIKNAQHLLRWGDRDGWGRWFLTDFKSFLEARGHPCPCWVSEAFRGRLLGSDPQSARRLPLRKAVYDPPSSSPPDPTDDQQRSKHS